MFMDIEFELCSVVNCRQTIKGFYQAQNKIKIKNVEKRPVIIKIQNNIEHNQ